MSNRAVYVYVFDTMADWEIGFLTAELNSGRFFRKDATPAKVITFGLKKDPITTMGGLKVTPDMVLEECNIKETDALILPGGNTWMEPIHESVLHLAKECIEKDIIVGAICGATMALGNHGLLDSRNHTSNDLGYLKMVCPNYNGEQHYKQEAAVTDGKLITAPGIAPLEFTVHVLRALDVFSEKTLDAWHKLYQTHAPEHFYELMSSIN